MSVSKFDRAASIAIEARAHSMCEHCGTRGIGMQKHHRHARGMGGSRDPRLGRASNGLLLLPRCHRYIEEHRMEALRKGWLVPSTVDPETVPVLLWNGWHQLIDVRAVPIHLSPLSVPDWAVEESSESGRTRSSRNT